MTDVFKDTYIFEFFSCEYMLFELVIVIAGSNNKNMKNYFITIYRYMYFIIYLYLISKLSLNI